jgi:hypothetical protein
MTRQSQISSILAAIALALPLAFASQVFAALKSGVYQTLPGATVEEFGDAVPNERRIVPISATLTFDLNAAPPSLTAFIPNAVLEGGNPFPLTVRSSSAGQLTSGAWRFSGEYLPDTQYLFDWDFSTSTNGQVLWNGITGWAGGHIWQITISNLTLVPLPRLSISRAGAAAVEITWPTNSTDFILEYASSLPAARWNTVTKPVATVGDRFSVTDDTNAPKRFYRLRNPSTQP